jgi:hypothetical protein
MTLVSEQITQLFPDDTIASKAYTYSEVIGNGTQDTFFINHYFNTKRIVVQVFETGGDNEVVLADVEMTSNNSVTITFEEPPLPGQYTIVVIGG